MPYQNKEQEFPFSDNIMDKKLTEHRKDLLAHKHAMISSGLPMLWYSRIHGNKTCCVSSRYQECSKWYVVVLFCTLTSPLSHSRGSNKS